MGQNMPDSSRKSWAPWKLVLSYLIQVTERSSGGDCLHFAHRRSMFMHRAGRMQQHRHSSRSSSVSSITKESKRSIVLLMSSRGNSLQLLQPRGSD